MKTDKKIQVVDLNRHKYTAPSGLEFIFRFSLDLFVPTQLVPALETYLTRIKSYVVVPIAEHEPLYLAYQVDDIAQFFLNHIGSDFTLVTRTLDGANNHKEDSNVLREATQGSMGDGVRQKTVSDMLRQTLSPGEV